MLKKTMLLCLLAFAVGCQESLEERTLREVQEYTRRRCPENQGNNAILDSLTFDAKTHTLTHYYRLTGVSDNEENATQMKDHLNDEMIEATRKDMGYKRYKDAGYSFRYIARSDSSGKVIYDQTITKEDYGY